ncbi:type II toxin-antitoxin system RelE/ParE family toxin [Massilia sp. NR 4-1]|uniref:type II toxin-antitoxin system RelE/ParE family toxin n=1 Tax=Massilia sp. NR 4-1 TaxID=1678028 RepID=UPI00067CB536|nr:type II toxin-antitoxin system RelE/ParE family toxin [Massilia sp. NR 4-1]AKU24333.1 hypothetical protein ACZ75_25615 [Massilia sp. NR 4-1]
MAKLVWIESGWADAEHIFDFLAQTNPTHAAATLKNIRDALDILKHAPQIGRPAAKNCRELLIGRHHGGYTAVYRYDATTDMVLILKIRSQRQLPSS